MIQQTFSYLFFIYLSLH